MSKTSRLEHKSTEVLGVRTILFMWSTERGVGGWVERGAIRLSLLKTDVLNTQILNNL